MIIRKKRIKRATYNKAHFYIEANETTGGRRIASHEFPYIDDPATEDMGRRQKQWEIAGYVAGPMYKEDSKALQDALDKDGVGVLDHPYLGKNMQVRCTSYRIAELGREFGFIRYLMTFVEAGSVPEITSKSLTASPTKGFLAKVLDTFNEGANAASGFVYDTADTFNQLSEAIEDKIAPMVGFRDSLGALADAQNQMMDVAMEIVTEPVALYNTFLSLTKLFIEAPITLLASVGILNVALDPLFDGFKPPSVEASTPMGGEISGDTATIKQTKAELVSETFAAVAIIQMSSPLVDGRPELTASRAEAQETFIQRADQYLAATQNPVLFDVIASLKAQTIATMQQQALQRGTRIVPTRTNSNLILLTYEMYGDATKESLLTDSNSFPEPAYIPSGTMVEVA